MEIFTINLPDPKEVAENIRKSKAEEKAKELDKKEKLKQLIYVDIKEHIIPRIERVAKSMCNTPTTCNSYSLASDHYFILTNDFGLPPWHAEDVFKATVREFVNSFNEEQLNRYKSDGSMFSLVFQDKYSNRFTTSRYSGLDRYTERRGSLGEVEAISYSLVIRFHEGK